MVERHKGIAVILPSYICSSDNPPEVYVKKRYIVWRQRKGSKRENC